jgi:hypothetical protein
VAKKKRKKGRRPAPRATGGGPSTAVGTETDAEDAEAPETARPSSKERRRGREAAPVSNRQARKEAARRERERRLKAARRRARTRRLVRWGVVLAVLGGIAAVIWYQVTAGRRLEEEATAAAAAFDCSDPEPPLPDAGRGHEPPFAEGQGGIPAASGNHTPTTLPPEPKVYEQPVPEANAVHNLEHGYVMVYYRADGENALPEPVLTELEQLVEGESEVIMAPYPNLAEGSNLALVAWRRVQTCQVPADADAADAATVARHFIDRFRNELAPEAAAT